LERGYRFAIQNNYSAMEQKAVLQHRSPTIPLPKPALVSQSGICWAGLIGDEVAEGLVRFAVMR
jgi:hypothetical protein